MEPLLSKRKMTANLEFAKLHLKDCESMRKMFLWFDETRIKFLMLVLGLNAVPKNSMVVVASCSDYAFHHEGVSVRSGFR